ncbi:MAG TPA: ribosome small subunit-dependent GTPase A [Opitutaceae bacterium]
MSLSALGWTDALAASFQSSAAAGLVPARVAVQHKNAYELLTEAGAVRATCVGKLLHDSATPADLPAVGDWVAVRLRPLEPYADIHAVLPRRTLFSRRAPGGDGGEQVVAANVDTVFLVTALDQNYNLRRIERYLAVAWQSGAQPVVLLNKADLHPDPAAARAEVEAVAATAPVVVVSALHDAAATLGALAPWLTPGQTLALLGSSGVGKSTLVNTLLGAERQRTSHVSDAVGKGRHTTTHRELIVAPAGWIVIDTPGMRELQLWDTDDASLDATFADVAALAARCRFSDCAHRGEPGCAIQAALDDGTLDFDRWQSFQKLQREQAYAARKSDPRIARARQAEWKKIHRQHRADTRSQREFFGP